MFRVIERYYTTKELAERLGVHPETIRREAARGRLPSVRVGRERRYPESGVAAYLACRTTPTSTA
jgi:excisionase family DNA binding protein